MKNLPREWILGMSAALVAVVLFLIGGRGEPVAVNVAARGTYDAAPVPEPRLLPVDAKLAWPDGRDPMAPATEWSDLPAEDLGLPDFPANPMPVPPIRPVTEARSRTKSITIAAVDLPDPAPLRSLGKSDLPPVGPPSETIWDTVILNDGSTKEGTILKVDATGKIQMRDKSGRQTMYFEKGQYTEFRYGLTAAKQYLEDAAKAKSAKDHEALAETCLKKNLIEEAAKEYEASLRMGVKAEILLKLADVYALLSDPDREVSFYRELLEKKPGSVELVWGRLGRVYEALGLPTRAMDAYQNALKGAPFFAEGRQRLVALFSSDGRMPEAEAQYAALSGDLKQKDLPETHLSCGTLAYFAGRFDEAKTELLQADKAGLLLLGCAQASLGQGKDAAASFKGAIEANPDNIDAWLNLGLLCAIAGDPVKAQACFDEASYRSPISPNPYAALGWMQMKAAKAAEATAAFDEALKRDSRCAFALLCKGKMALDAGKASDAEPSLLSALKAGAGGQAFRELGLARLRMKNTSGAVEALRRAADSASDPDAHALLGFALLPTNPPAAEQEFRRAKEIDTAHVLAELGLAAVVYNRRELSDARSRFESVLSREATNPFAQRGKRLSTEAATRRWWHDEFERKDGDAVRRTWVEKEKEGLRITLANGHARIAGKQNRDDAITALLRPTSDRFLSFEAEIDFAKIGRATAGVTIAIPASPQMPNPYVLRLARSPKGMLAIAYGPMTPPPAYKEFGECPSGVVRFKIERGGASGQEYVMSANGVAIDKPVRGDMLRSQKLEVGVFGTAFKDEAWELGIDNARLVEAK